MELEEGEGEAETEGGSLSFARLSEEKGKQIPERRENGIGSPSHRFEMENYKILTINPFLSLYSLET